MMYVHVRCMWRIGEYCVSAVSDYARFGSSVAEDSVILIYGLHHIALLRYMTPRHIPY